MLAAKRLSVPGAASLQPSLPTQTAIRLAVASARSDRDAFPQVPTFGLPQADPPLRREGWQAGRKLVQRIRRECDLRVKRWMKRPQRRGCSTGTIPTRAERINHVWSWDFISDRTDNGGKLRILSVIDEYSRECLALHVARKLTAASLGVWMDQPRSSASLLLKRTNITSFLAPNEMKGE